MCRIIEGKWRQGLLTKHPCLLTIPACITEPVRVTIAWTAWKWSALFEKWYRYPIGCRQLRQAVLKAKLANKIEELMDSSMANGAVSHWQPDARVEKEPKKRRSRPKECS